jgi:hypothetical protein
MISGAMLKTLAAAFVLFCGAQLARANTTYLSNFGGTGFNENGDVNIGGGLSYAIEFTTGTLPETLVDAQLKLTYQSTSGDVLTLNTVAAGLPGSVLTTFTTPTLTSGTGLTVVFTDNFLLAANTSYFLVLSGSATASQWSSTFTGAAPNGLTPTSTLGATYVTQKSGSGGVYSAATTIPDVELDISNAPEPSSLVLGSVGIVLIALLLRKRYAA